jgi:hypothetical protein
MLLRMCHIYLLAFQSLTSDQNYIAHENFLLKSVKQAPRIHSTSIYYEV